MWIANILLQTEQVMMKSLKTITTNAVKDYVNRKRDAWLLNWPGQVVLAVSQIYWTSQVEAALRTGGADGLSNFATISSQNLQDEVKLVRGELTKLQRATLGALVVIDVHARDVRPFIAAVHEHHTCVGILQLPLCLFKHVKHRMFLAFAMSVDDGSCNPGELCLQVLVEMSSTEVSLSTDFSWQAQLRYYWEQDTVIVRMLNAFAMYGYEYLGNSSRLVITPLTDRWDT